MHKFIALTSLAGLLIFSLFSPVFAIAEPALEPHSFDEEYSLKPVTTPHGISLSQDVVTPEGDAPFLMGLPPLTLAEKETKDWISDWIGEKVSEKKEIPSDLEIIEFQPLGDIDIWKSLEETTDLPADGIIFVKPLQLDSLLAEVENVLNDPAKQSADERERLGYLYHPDGRESHWIIPPLTYDEVSQTEENDSDSEAGQSSLVKPLVFNEIVSDINNDDSLEVPALIREAARATHKK